MKQYAHFLESKKHKILAGADEVISGIKAKFGSDPCWLVELSIPELYQTNEDRLGEIIVRENASNNEECDVVLVRIPGLLTILFPDGRHEHYGIGGAYHYEIERRTPTKFRELFQP